MKFRMYFGIDEEACIRILRDNGFNLETAYIDDETTNEHYFITLISINSFDDIKNIQKILDSNPYPVDGITFDFSNEYTCPTMYIDND